MKILGIILNALVYQGLAKNPQDVPFTGAPVTPPNTPNNTPTNTPIKTPINYTPDRVPTPEIEPTTSISNSEWENIYPGGLNGLKGDIGCDSPEPWQIGFQDSATPGFTGIVELHNIVFFYLIVICVAVFYLLFIIIKNYSYNNNPIVYKYLNHGTVLETIWTTLPALVLAAIAIPSFRLLYLLDEVTSPGITIKVNGHQWYWSYEYSDFVTESNDPIEFDSYMVPDSDLELGMLRLLEVDSKLILPSKTHTRFIVSSTDVLHSFGVPSLGLKLDACPGRLNQASAFLDRIGTFWGQCSEICGVYHAFMPISIEVVNLPDFLSFLESNDTKSNSYDYIN